MSIPYPAERSARLNMRIAPDALETIREAAIAQQQDITGFVLGAAMDRARAVVLEERALRAGPADTAPAGVALAEDDFDDGADSDDGAGSADSWLIPEFAQMAREAWRALGSARQ
jgi:uncharacterized protein (DUF1778 family)